MKDYSAHLQIRWRCCDRHGRTASSSIRGPVLKPTSQPASPFLPIGRPTMTAMGKWRMRALWAGPGVGSKLRTPA